MLKLLKYEYRKKSALLLILVGLTILAQAVLMYGINADKEELLFLGALFLLLLAFTGVICMGIHSISTLHHDMNTRQSYMLFMTPHSTYAILGAKVLECCLSLLLSSAIYFGLGLLDVRLVLNHYDQLQMLYEMFERFLDVFGQQVTLDLSGISCFCFSMVAYWFFMILAAFFADIVASALLNGKKFGGFVCFILYVLLLVGVSEIIRYLPTSPDLNTTYILYGVEYLVFSVIMYIFSAKIMEKYLSV